MSQHQTGESENYRVVFVGLADGSEANIQAFSEKLSKGFGIPMDKALRITRNAPIVIKKGISRSKAERYQQFFVKLGGQVRIEETDVATQPRPVAARSGTVEGFETTAIESQEPVAETVGPGSQEQNLPKDDSMAKAYDNEIAGVYEESFTPPTQSPPKLPEASVFQCPQCGQKQEKDIECVKCGIIFEKYERMAEAQKQAEAPTDQVPTDQVPFDQASGEEEPASVRDLEVKIEHAGFWIRAGAYIVDGVLVNLMFFALAIGLFLLLGGVRNPRTLASVSPMVAWISPFLFFGYYIYFLGKRGYTPGKGFLGLQVIRQDGTGMSYGDAAIRTFSYIISSIALYLGFFWIGFDRNKQGWHDKIAKTQVIKAEEVSAWRKWVVFIPAVLVPLIGVVAAIGIPVYLGYASRADVAKAVSEMQVVKTHLEEHFYRYDRYPLTGEFRSFLNGNLGRIPGDPFNHGRPYRYESDGSAFTLWSVGPDRVDNGAGISYDPLATRGFQQKGDIVIHSDEGIDQSDELFGMTLEGTGQSGELFGMTPSTP